MPRDENQAPRRRSASPPRVRPGLKFKEKRGEDQAAPRDDRDKEERRRARKEKKEKRRREAAESGQPEEEAKEKKKKKPAAAVTDGEEMIIVNVNDRMGTKAAIPCYASDTVKNFKIMVAARIGRNPHEILLKRQGERPFKDHITLGDYGVGNGVQLDLEVDTGD